MVDTKIVLSMIVKNEGHVIERVLHSVIGFIDTYCIVDTGSTDDTKEKILNFFETNGISGKIIDFPFTNFEECRNISLEGSKELGDYAFWIDADEQLILDKTFNKNTFKKKLIDNKVDLVNFSCDYSSVEYKRAQLFNLKTDFFWYGPVHEVLINKDKNHTNKYLNFDKGKVLITPDGNSWTEENSLHKKYEKHAQILLDYQEKNEFKDPRWTFYLAQSYRDAGTILYNSGKDKETAIDYLKKSVFFYKKRAEQRTGYLEEVYFSQLMVARLSYYFKNNSEIVVELLKCEEVNFNNRIEHFFNLVSYLQSENMHINALEYCKKAMSNVKKGTDASLFVEKSIYDWCIYDLYAISLYYTGNVEESLKYFNYCLTKLDTKSTNYEQERKRIEDNIKSIETATGR